MIEYILAAELLVIVISAAVLSYQIEKDTKELKKEIEELDSHLKKHLP